VPTSGISSGRIGSSLVEAGGATGSLAESIEALEERRAIDIAHDMLHYFELLAGIADEENAPWRWPLP
jgi:hypothetical protein